MKRTFLIILSLLCSMAGMAQKGFVSADEFFNTRCRTRSVDVTPQSQQFYSTTYDAGTIIYPSGIATYDSDGDDPFGGEDIGGTSAPNEPSALPIGDVPVGFVLLLALAYILLTARRRVVDR